MYIYLLNQLTCQGLHYHIHKLGWFKSLLDKVLSSITHESNNIKVKGPYNRTFISTDNSFLSLPIDAMHPCNVNPVVLISSLDLSPLTQFLQDVMDVGLEVWVVADSTEWVSGVFHPGSLEIKMVTWNFTHNLSLNKYPTGTQRIIETIRSKLLPASESWYLFIIVWTD